MAYNLDFYNIQQLLDVPAHLCPLSTTAADGTPNSAMLGSVRLHGENIVVGLGENHTLHNLEQNPIAMLLLMVPSASVMPFRKVRMWAFFQA